MWEAVKLDPKTEKFSQVATGETLEECKSKTENKSAQGDGVFYFWAGKFPDGEAESTALFNKIKDANDGLISVMTVGVDFSKIEKFNKASCSGKCFCVITSNSRRCETQYCNGAGYCWWVPCGQSC